MRVCRRDVVNVSFGSGTKGNHSVIILSPEEINSEEDSFLGMMITDSPHFDKNNDFSFVLDDTMFMKPLKEKGSKARLHLLNFLHNSVLVTNAKINEMKAESFKKMIDELNQKVFFS